jgi:hypothetical protein
MSREFEAVLKTIPLRGGREIILDFMRKSKLPLKKLYTFRERIKANSTCIKWLGFDGVKQCLASFEGSPPRPCSWERNTPLLPQGIVGEGEE